MKRFRNLLLAECLALLLLTGCSPSRNPSVPGRDGQEPHKEKLSVCASFYPMYDFARKIGGDKVHVINMVPAGTEPHDWEPAASDIVALEKADAFIYNGAGLEGWTGDVLASLRNRNLITVEASKNVPLLKEQGSEKDKGSKPASDPHVWLNPQYAKKEMENIKNGFVKADPNNQSYYEANYTKYAGEADQLDRELKDTFSALPKKDIVVAHQAFGYLCEAYGLHQIGVEGLVPDSEPDPARMAEIIELARKYDIKVIFFEELVSPKVSETIADAVGADTAVLNPIEGLSEKQLASGDDYFSVMRQNARALKKALQ